MGPLIWHVTMSLDGFIAGPDDSMDWVVGQWSEDGTNTRDVDVQRSSVAEDVLHAAGAVLGGRRWYDVAQARYDGVDGVYGGQWPGPVFVLTHRPPTGPADERVTFLTGSVTDAVDTARAGAGAGAVVVFGAQLAAQCLDRGLLDEVVVHVVPVLLGAGVRLFDAPGTPPILLTRTRVASSGQITDLRFDVPRQPVRVASRYA